MSQHDVQQPGAAVILPTDDEIEELLKHEHDFDALYDAAAQERQDWDEAEYLNGLPNSDAFEDLGEEEYLSELPNSDAFEDLGEEDAELEAILSAQEAELEHLAESVDWNGDRSHGGTYRRLIKNV